MRDIFEGESKIRKIGGRVEDDYYSFANSVLFVNANIIPLFFMLGFNHPEDKDFIVGFLSESVARNKIKEAYIDHVPLISNWPHLRKNRNRSIGVCTKFCRFSILRFIRSTRKNTDLHYWDIGKRHLSLAGNR